MADAKRRLSCDRWMALTAAHEAGGHKIECVDQATTDDEDGHRYFRVLEPVVFGGFIFLPQTYRAA